MTNETLSIDEFVDYAVSWACTGKPDLDTFKFYDYIKRTDYISALEKREEWRVFMMSGYDIIDYRRIHGD